MEDEDPRQPPPPLTEAINGLANGKKAPKGYAMQESVGGENSNPGIAAVDDQQQVAEPVPAKREDFQSEDQIATPLGSTETIQEFEQNKEDTRLGMLESDKNNEQTEMKMEVEA